MGKSDVSGPRLDALEREIFRYTVRSITEELEINITRTASSPLIQEAQDYAIALMTADFRPFVQSEASIPIFVSDMGEPVRDAASVIGVDNLEPGDVFINNFESGQHINNVVLGTGLYHGDELTGYLSVRAHWADLGGLVPGGQAMGSRAVFHEGTRYRGLRLMRRGTLVPEVMATVQANTWQKDSLTGDVMAQLAACVQGARRWQERVATRWSAEEVRELTAAQLAASRDYARRAIAAIPDGTYRAEHDWRWTQGGEELDLHFDVAVTIDGDRFVVDLSGMPPQTPLPINAGSVGGGMAAVRLAFRYLLDGPDVPTDAGLFEPVEIILPEGTIVSATGDAPIGFWNTTMPLLIDLVIHAIGQAHPTLVPASHHASIGGIMFYGRRADGSWWRSVEGAIGGLGAEADRDGFGPVKALMTGDFKMIPLEMTESRFPLRYHCLRLRRDAGGAGKHRGGPGVERVIEVLTDVSFDSYADPSMPAPGLAGGEPGKLSSTRVRVPGSIEWERPPGSTTGVSSLPAGTLIRQRTGGGGGWGTPTDAGDAPELA